LALVFTIMEIGHLAFRTLLVNHAAYEAARVGSLTTTPAHATPACAVPSLNAGAIDRVGHRFLTGPAVLIKWDGPLPTLKDPQDGCMNYDVEVTIEDLVPLVFVPLTGLFLGKLCDGSSSVQFRCVKGTVRMPIERPLFK
jgi:hypothetical protein